MIMQITLHDSSGSLSFLSPKITVKFEIRNLKYEGDKSRWGGLKLDTGSPCYV